MRREDKLVISHGPYAVDLKNIAAEESRAAQAGIKVNTELLAEAGQ